ncbi:MULTISPECIES: hypothetical protein [Cetobacterium]|uniref:Uncharacterized protein n=1 Tax=Candidatus Cetobacterium colombiensis TaxID=3073100 RepID=A0ABU4WC19_9FUSO|nr:hypothetical protein [Candidatus Cetobacterium colombiensis]MDX8337092.1 hypothetical protein [Candidatus Cetobacterium colombiensis]
MKRKSLHLLSYEVNELKFLEALSKGVTFETTHKLFYSKQSGDKKHYEQTLQYNLFCNDFLELNKVQLLKLEIIKIKE